MVLVSESVHPPDLPKDFPSLKPQAPVAVRTGVPGPGAYGEGMPGPVATWTL